MAQNVVNRQLAKLAMASAPPFSSASVGAQPPVALRRVADGIQGVTVSMLSAVPLAHDRVADALRSAWRVVVEKRDRVTADELRMARREILGDLQTQWKERDQTESSSLADEARDHFLLAAPYVDDRDEVALAAALLQTVTVEDVREAIAAMFPAENLDAVVAATRPAPGFRWPWQAPSVPAAALEAELQTLLDDAAGGAVAATEAFDADAFFAPPAGDRAPVTSRRLPLPNGLEALELSLGNGGTVTFVRTDFKDDEVVLFGCAAGGLSRLCGRGARDAKLAMSARGGASLAGRYGAVGAPRAALNDALGGRRVALGADIDAYRRIVSGDCTADEVETLFGLLARLFANTPQRSEAQARTYVDASRDAVRERERDPGARFATKRDQLVTRDHPFWRHWTNAGPRAEMNISARISRRRRERRDVRTGRPGRVRRGDGVRFLRRRLRVARRLPGRHRREPARRRDAHKVGGRLPGAPAGPGAGPGGVPARRGVRLREGRGADHRGGVRAPRRELSGERAGRGRGKGDDGRGGHGRRRAAGARAVEVVLARARRRLHGYDGRGEGRGAACRKRARRRRGAVPPGPAHRGPAVRRRRRVFGVGLH